MPNLKLKLLIISVLALFVSGIGNSFASNYYSKYGHSYAPHSYSKKNSYKSQRYAQNNNVRSRSEVMQEVKQRYNAKVLKISLNEKAGVYKVRMLMPNGKVRSIQVSAR